MLKKEPLPFERSDKVIGLAGSTHLGFDKAHLTQSETKTMMKTMDDKFK